MKMSRRLFGKGAFAVPVAAASAALPEAQPTAPKGWLPYAPTASFGFPPGADGSNYPRTATPREIAQDEIGRLRRHIQAERHLRKLGFEDVDYSHSSLEDLNIEALRSVSPVGRLMIYRQRAERRAKTEPTWIEERLARLESVLDQPEDIVDAVLNIRRRIW